MDRIERTNMLMYMALLVSMRSSCPRGGQVGALIAREGRVIATGYCGSPSGQPHCLEAGCLIDPQTSGCVRTVHAEANALAFAARHGIATEGADLYCTLSPCLSCAKLLVNSGLKRVFYAVTYRKQDGIELLQQAGIETTKLTLDALTIPAPEEYYAKRSRQP